MLVGCRIFEYQLSTARQFGAPALFAALCGLTTFVPFPLIDLVAPLVGLYVALMDDRFERARVRKVFSMSVVGAVICVFAFYGGIGA